MLQSKNMIIVVLLLFSILTSFSVLALSNNSPQLLDQQLQGRDESVFEQSLHAISKKNWPLAQSLLYGLYRQFPENIRVKNNLAIVYFNLDKLEKSQQLFSSIIEQNKLTAIAYKNLKKLYSYSAAKTYSSGLNLLKPVDLPELTIIDSIEPTDNYQIATNQVIVYQPNKITGSRYTQKKRQKIKTKPFVKTTEKYQNDSKQVKNQLAKTSKSAQAQKQLLAKLEQWRKAWVDGDNKAYIALYKKNYSPRGKSHRAWVKNRTEKVVKSKNITVTINKPKLYINKSISRANILFNQHYSSKNYSDRVQKRLYWIKEQGQWYIEKESIIKIM